MVVPGVRAAAGKAVGKAVSSHAVPGVRAAAGKAGSSQSSLAKAVSSQSSRIFASALVDCNWLRLRRCENLCFYAALMSLHDF